MTTKLETKSDALHTLWNLARSAYYCDPTPDNEQRMDDALVAFLNSKEADVK